MKVQIRRSVFETNSSSVHTITMSKDCNSYKKNPIPEKLVFHTSCYGWEVEKYDTPNERASYLYTALVNISNETLEDDKRVITDILAKHGCEAVFEEVPQNSWSDCYIDHGNELDEFIGVVMSGEDALMEYLFGDSCVYTYNDNMGYYDMRYSKEIDNLSDNYYKIRKGN